MFKLVAVFTFDSFDTTGNKRSSQAHCIVGYFTFYQILSSGFFMHTEKDIRSMLACNSEHFIYFFVTEIFKQVHILLMQEIF